MSNSSLKNYEVHTKCRSWTKFVNSQVLSSLPVGFLMFNYGFLQSLSYGCRSRLNTYIRTLFPIYLRSLTCCRRNFCKCNWYSWIDTICNTVIINFDLSQILSTLSYIFLLKLIIKGPVSLFKLFKIKLIAVFIIIRGGRCFLFPICAKVTMASSLWLLCIPAFPSISSTLVNACRVRIIVFR